MNCKIAIILLNYKNHIDTLECIKSIEKNEKQLKYKIIVVDNNSCDNSCDILRKLTNIDLIERKINDGFACGNNVGIEYARANYDPEYILLLNNDTVIEKNSITNMLNRIDEDEDIGAVSCKIMKYYDKSKVDCLGGKIDWNKVIGRFNYIYENNNKYYSEIISGACMLIRKDVIDKIGLLSEDYFMYYEDLDYSFRIRNAGYKIGIDKDTIIYHKAGGSAGDASPFAIRWNNRNRIVFYKKYKGNVNKIYFILYFIVTRIIYVLHYIIHFNKEYLKALYIGIRDGAKWYEKNNTI